MRNGWGMARGCGGGGGEAVGEHNQVDVVRSGRILGGGEGFSLAKMGAMGGEWKEEENPLTPHRDY